MDVSIFVDHTCVSFPRIGKQYLDEKMTSLARKAVRGEDLDDGTFVAYLVCQDKLKAEEVYGTIGEILPASVDTVSSIAIRRAAIT